MFTLGFTLGVVPYLNALPLYHTLQDGDCRIFRAVPSKLSPMLQAGECDVALLPVVEHFRGVGESITSDACIGATGPVRSVLLFHRAPIQSLTSIAADTSSRTSVALLRVLLADAFNVSPPFVAAAPDLRAMLQAHPGALLIGDPALRAAQAPPPDVSVLDLGQAWRGLTGLPFVFAAWVCRRGLSEAARGQLAAQLSQARDEGTQQVADIAREAAPGQGITTEVVESYLRHAINFRLTAEHRAGLEEFHRRCQANGLI